MKAFFKSFFASLTALVVFAGIGFVLLIGIVAAMAFDPEADDSLSVLNVSSLFVPNTTRLALRRGVYLRRYAHALIEQLIPRLTEAKINDALRHDAAMSEDYTI